MYLPTDTQLVTGLIYVQAWIENGGTLDREFVNAWHKRALEMKWYD